MKNRYSKRKMTRHLKRVEPELQAVRQEYQSLSPQEQKQVDEVLRRLMKDMPPELRLSPRPLKKGEAK